MHEFLVPKTDVKTELWYRGDLSWKLDGLQQQISSTVERTNAKKICILSSRQIGKSYWACDLALEYLIRNPKKIARILAPTLKQCQDIVEDNLNPICQDAPAGFIEPQKSAYRWRLHNGSSLRLGALERAHVDGNRGGNASLIIYEECGFVGGDDFRYGVNSVLGPQLLRSNGREIFVSSPSEDPDHPLHTEILPECESLGSAFRYTVYDSPSLTREQIDEAIRRCGGESTDAWQREYLARIIRPSTLMVLPDFGDRHIVKFNLPHQFHMHVTTDWGGVRDLTVSLLHTYCFMSNKFLVVDEKVFAANTPTSTIVDSIREWEKAYHIHSRWADVPGQTQVDLAQTYDYDLNLPPKSDWVASVNNMAVKFTTDQIMIHPRCEFLVQSCRGGLFNNKRTDFERTEKLGHMDALASLMYALRVQSTENPYRVTEIPNDRYFVPKQPTEDIVDIGKMLNPKRFGNFR